MNQINELIKEFNLKNSELIQALRMQRKHLGEPIQTQILIASSQKEINLERRTLILDSDGTWGSHSSSGYVCVSPDVEEVILEYAIVTEFETFEMSESIGRSSVSEIIKPDQERFLRCLLIDMEEAYKTLRESLSKSQ
ncbi:MAG: hypothetical protein WCW87_04190 [Candidatus Paceibacterota bacterium]